MNTDSQKLQEAYRYCRWITEHHYENFPVASWLLPRDKRPFIAAIYAFARSADDFADESKYQGRSLELLNLWRSSLRACTNGTRQDHPIFLALSDALKRCDLPIQLCDDLLTAFIMDVTKKRYADWEELLTYCRYSANPVGRLVLRIFGYQDEQLLQLSDYICTGLQLANHWQDLAVDLAKDRLYIPQDFLERYQVSEKNLFSHEATPGFQSLMEELVTQAHVLFDAGEPLLDHVRGRLRWELKLTLLGGRAILNRIGAARYDVFRHRPALSAFNKLTLGAYALFS